jgi:integrase
VGGVAGLALQVTASGARSGILRARVGGKRRDMGLGGYPDVPLAQARDKAREARDKIAEGVDVVAERQAARQRLIARQAKRMTFTEAAYAKHEALRPQFRNARHQQNWIRAFELYAFPTIGALDVADIELAHVVQVLRPIWQTRTETARRLRGRIEAVLDWATVTGHRTGANPAKWRGVLSEVLPQPRKIAKRGHHAALPWRDVPGFMAALRKRKGASARALEFAILTAARSGEVRGMTWGEFEAAAKLWTVAGDRMKAGKTHRVPLTAAALAVVKAQPRMKSSPYVFAAARGGQLSDMSLSAICRRMGVAAVPHGFRSSFKDWARNCTSYPDEVSELCLAHVASDATRAAYARDGLLAKRARLLAEWAEFCAKGLPDAASVTPIRGAA